MKDEKKTLNKNIADKKSDTSFIAFFHRISRMKNNRASFFVIFNTTSIIVCEDNTAIPIILNERGDKENERIFLIPGHSSHGTSNIPSLSG